jgi:putative transposase
MKPKKQIENEQIKAKIQECYQAVHGIYGYPRVNAWLRKKYNLTINHKRVYRLMKELGIQAKIRRKRKYFGKKEAYVVSDNHLNREISSQKTKRKVGGGYNASSKQWRPIIFIRH